MWKDETSIGGSQALFPQTKWTMMLDPAKQQEILEEICTKYWKPVYFYIRRKGYNNADAKELTQDFFQTMIERELIRKADRRKGRFRYLLLTALNNFLASSYRSAKKNITCYSFNSNIDSNIDMFGSPEEAFHYAWAQEIVHNVIEQLKNECQAGPLAVHWKLFCERVLRPIGGDIVTPSLKELCSKYNVASPEKASNMIVTIKRRFRTVLMSYLRKYAGDGNECEAEFKELVNILSNMGARKGAY